MKWKPKRRHVITRGFAFLPTYIPRTKEYVWLEKIFVFIIDAPYGSAYCYDTDYRALYYGCVRPFGKSANKGVK